jgi:hypothetical protein
VNVLNTNTKVESMKIILQRVTHPLLIGIVALVLHGLCAGSAWAQASNVYITPDGGGSGICTTNTHAPNWFNNGANWGSGASSIGPGTIVHLCGAFTGAANTSMLTAAGSGTSGNPVTILFESGARLSAPYWSQNGAINLQGQSFITVNGDHSNGKQGVIENTDNGTVLGNRQSSRGINYSNTNGVTIKNISIINIYVHAFNNSGEVDQTAENAVHGFPANNLLLTNTLMHDCGWCVDGNGSNYEVSFSEIYNMDHGIAFGCNGSCTNVFLHDNHIHDMKLWDGNGHHDGIHLFSEAGPTNAPILIYNNLFDGDMGLQTTAWIFLEGADGQHNGLHGDVVFNNVLINQTPSSGKNVIWFEGRGQSSNESAYNNYSNAGAHDQGAALIVRDTANFSGANNVLIGGNGDVGFTGGTLARYDYNLYDDLNIDGGGNNLFGWKGPIFGSLLSFQSACNCDAHSIVAPLSLIKMDSSGHPLNGSATIGKGTNLTSLGITALNKDKNGNTRPSSGAWDVGAYSSGTTSTILGPPTGLKVTVQ